MSASKNPVAELHTNQGVISIELHADKAPKTVANFIGLATGQKEFTCPTSGEPTKKAYYDGLVFHRVISNFMIQGGCPQGTGYGNPGYKFDDEFHPELWHDKKGVMSMANSGPNTNGSQFFITTGAHAHLDAGRQSPTPTGYSIFGQVIDGMDALDKIAQTPTAAGDRPHTDMVIEKVVIK